MERCRSAGYLRRVALTGYNGTMGFTRRSLLRGAAACLLARAEINKPKQALIIRHAEKPQIAKDIHLSQRGFERAAQLPRLFPAQFDTPDFLFAAAPTKHSNRPIETLTPLAQALRLRVNVRFGENDVRGLAGELSKADYAGRTVLICWHHGRIPDLSAALGVADPPVWHEDVFDRVWKIQWTGDAAQLTDLPQHLLQGDS